MTAAKETSPPRTWMASGDGEIPIVRLDFSLAQSSSVTDLLPRMKNMRLWTKAAPFLEIRRK